MRKVAQDMFVLGGEERRKDRECPWSAERAFTSGRDFSKLRLFGFFFKVKKKIERLDLLRKTTAKGHLSWIYTPPHFLLDFYLLS